MCWGGREGVRNSVNSSTSSKLRTNLKNKIHYYFLKWIQEQVTPKVFHLYSGMLSTPTRLSYLPHICIYWQSIWWNNVLYEHEKAKSQAISECERDHLTLLCNSLWLLLFLTLFKGGMHECSLHWRIQCHRGKGN